MKKLSMLAAVAAIVAFGAPARAEVIDLSTIKCSDIAKMSNDEASYIMVWLHGYFGGKAGDTTMDTDAFTEAGKAIGAKCAESPDLGLMTVVDQLSADGQ